MITISVNMLAFCIGVLPDAALWILVRTMAFLSFDVLRVRRRVILDNLNIVFGQSKSVAEKIKIGRLSTAHTFLTFVRFIGSKRVYPRQKINIVGRENAEKAVAKGRGIYILGIHCGDFELMGPQGTKNFVKTNVVTKPVGGRELSKWIKERRADNGEFEIERAHKGMGQMKIFEALDRNEMVGFMVDQRRSKGMLLPFFGKPSMTNTSLFYLWKNRPSPIVPILCLRTGIDTNDLHFLPEFEVKIHPGESDEDFYRNNTLRMNAYVEEMILRAPEQYFWMHKRWKV